ncbi:MAG: hypothetical protein AB1746_16530 [Candidatus Zixiibacteriota bacterium]
MKLKHLYFALGVMVSVIVASLLADRYGLPYQGWFLGGLMIGLSGQIFMVSAEKRTALNVVLSLVVTGVVTTLAYFVIHKLS